MDGIACDRCGKALLVGESVRYEVKIEVKAAYDPMEVTRDDLDQDLNAEIRRLIDRMKDMDPQVLEDQVYKAMTFDLCMACQKGFIANPLARASGGQRTHGEEI